MEMRERGVSRRDVALKFRLKTGGLPSLLTWLDGVFRASPSGFNWLWTGLLGQTR